ncbi:hypothetical protein NDU88_005843 [Pleurodeles waltl]|uniref:Uncharacterized protein n=1 Tax=Pleurodeles waltl TaxID=8319 RepID=A0AAV7QJE8_PLEWA|nr:hypothetical protein NDU88_005843 [Pleurodeles waltl]
MLPGTRCQIDKKMRGRALRESAVRSDRRCKKRHRCKKRRRVDAITFPFVYHNLEMEKDDTKRLCENDNLTMSHIDKT